MNILQSVLGNLIITICEVAFVPEMLLQRKDARVALAEVCRQVPDAQRAWPQAGQHRGARRVALRLLAIGMLEHPAAFGQAIYVRADQVPFAKATRLWP